VSPAEAVLLGILQGLTEFLPVSSSGHLVIGEALLGIHEEGILFEIAVHAATLVAVVLFYRRRIGELLLGALRREGSALAYGAKLALATLPAVAVALLLRDFVEAQFESPVTVGWALLATGALLYTTRFTLPRASLPEPGYAAALAIGCAQAVAILPGISRSGATVATALALGVAPLAAAEFSFLLSIVAIAGAVVLALPDAMAASGERLASLGVGGAAALLSGVAALWLFLRLLRSRGFHHFAWYCWAAGGVLLVVLSLRG